MKFADAVQVKGPAAIGPLKSQDGSMVFYACHDGNPILKDGAWGPESSFKTEAEATEFATQYGEYLKTKP